MKCWLYKNLLADWIAGRLAEDKATRVAAHVDSCPRCRQAADAEARMRSVFSTVGEPSRTPDLWLRVQGRLAEPAPARRNMMNTRLAFAGAAASIAIVAVLIVPRVPSTPVSTGPGIVDKPIPQAETARAVTDLSSLHAQAQDDFLIETADYRPNARLVLIGGADR
jgi:predicted anti-sigma-YlaC factor YlaD